MAPSKPKLTVLDGDRGSVLLKVRVPDAFTVGALRKLVEQAANCSGLLRLDEDHVLDDLKLTADDADAVVRFYPDARLKTGRLASTEFGDNSNAPSSYTYSQTMAKQTAHSGPEFLNFMPSSAAPGLPLPLAHPAFGKFLDRFHDVEEMALSKEDTEMYDKLSAACSRFYKSELEYVKAVVELWMDYTGCREIPTGESEKGGLTRSDGGSVCTSSRVVSGFLEGKKGISGNHTEPGMQVTKNYAFFWLDNSALRERFRETCYPAVLLEHVGPHVRASAVVTLGQICVQPLTPFISFLKLQGHDVVAASQGVRFCRAVKALLQDLQDEYRSLAKELQDADVQEDVGEDLYADSRALYRAGIPYPLHPLLESVEDVRQLQPRVFCVKDMVIKYVQREYGEAVHKVWSDAGFAPELKAVEHLPGGWLEVTMEKLGDEWTRLLDHPRADEIRPKVVKALEEAHAVQVGMDAKGNPTYGVHGDMRDANVMVKDDAQDVRFIDFDWAKEEGQLYPPFMNHTDINWPVGAEDYKPMLQSHDKELLSKKQDMQVKYKARAQRRRHKIVQMGKAKLKALRNR